MIKLVAVLMLTSQQPLLVVPSVEETLYERGWKLIHTSKSERPQRTYIHPVSIRPASQTEKIYSVTSIIKTKNRDDDEWHTGTLGYLVNCTDMTFAQEWGMGRYKQRPVLDYFSAPLFRIPKGGQLEVVKRVCEDK